MRATRSSTKRVKSSNALREHSQGRSNARSSRATRPTTTRTTSMHCALRSLSAELLLVIVEFLDLKSRVCFSQAFRAVFHLSLSRYSFWKSTGILPIALPRIGEERQHPCDELRAAALKTLRLKENLENKEVRSFRRVQIPILNAHDPTFCTEYCKPLGTRWLFQYGFKDPGYSSIISAYDLIKERTIGSIKIPDRIQIVEAYSISISKFALAVLSQSPDRHEYVDIYTVTFKTLGKNNKTNVEFDYYRTIFHYDALTIDERFDFQNGWVTWSPDYDETMFYAERWDDPRSKRVFQTRPNSMFFQAMVGGSYVLALTSSNELEVFELPTQSSSEGHPLEEEAEEGAQDKDGNGEGNDQEGRTLIPIRSFMSTRICGCIHPNHISGWQVQEPEFPADKDRPPTWTFLLEPVSGIAYCKSWELPIPRNAKQRQQQQQQQHEQPPTATVENDQPPSPAQPPLMTTHGEVIPFTTVKKDPFQGATISETGRYVAWPDFKAKTYRIRLADADTPEAKKLVLGSTSTTKRAKGPWKWKDTVCIDDSAGIVILDHDAYYKTLYWLF